MLILMHLCLSNYLIVAYPVRQCIHSYKIYQIIKSTNQKRVDYLIMFRYSCSNIKLNIFPFWLKFRERCKNNSAQLKLGLNSTTRHRISCSLRHVPFEQARGTVTKRSYTKCLKYSVLNTEWFTTSPFLTKNQFLLYRPGAMNCKTVQF